VIRVAGAASIALGALALGVVPATLPAQAGLGYTSFWQRPVHVGLDAGGSVPTGQFASDFEPGWDIGGNVAVPVSPHGGIWIQGDVNYASQVVQPSVASAFGANGGGASLSSGTVNLVLNRRDYFGNVTPYLIFGGGVYWRYVHLDDYGAVAYCDDFIGYCGYYGAVPVRTRTQIAPGIDGGGGLRFRLRPVRFFLEARYNNLYTRHGNTAYVPIVFGTEW
jgi:hypothetical protein